MHLFYTALDYAFHNNQGLRHGWAPILKSCLASGHQAPPGRPPPLPRCRRKGNSSYGETCFPLVDGLLCPAPRPPLPCGLASIPLQLQQNFTAHLIGLQIITQPRRECWRRRHIDAHGWAGVAHANISHLRGPRGGTVKKDKIVKSWWYFQPPLVHQYARSLMNKYTQPCHEVDALHTRVTLKPCMFVDTHSAYVYPAHMSGWTISVYNCISSTIAMTQITIIPFPTWMFLSLSQELKSLNPTLTPKLIWTKSTVAFPLV